jgi:glucose-1-phosphate thymidylyltransferase
MKGVILAGGTGSRLFPLTKVTNKHLLPVGQEPMIFHPVKKLTGAGLDEILVVTGVDHMGDVVNLLGSGREFGCRFTYKVQDEAGGIAQALGLAENFAGGEPVCVILGDNVFADDLGPFVSAFERQRRGARVVLKQVPDPHRFGVAELKDGRIVRIVEKPKNPRSDLAVTGIYMYDGNVYDFVRSLRPSARGELEITDVNNAYVERGQLQYDLLRGWWTDAGTFDSLHRANELVRKPARPAAAPRASGGRKTSPVRSAPGRPAAGQGGTRPAKARQAAGGRR